MSMKFKASGVPALLATALAVLALSSCTPRLRITNATYQVDATGTIKNPGETFRQLYVAPAGTDQYGDNLLPNAIIAGNTFSFTKKVFAAAGEKLDFKLLTSAGMEFVVPDVELAKVGTIRVTDENRISGTGEPEAAAAVESSVEEEVEVQLGIDL